MERNRKNIVLPTRYIKIKYAKYETILLQTSMMSKLYGKKQKKYSADKQAYQNQIRQVRNDIATNIDDVKAIWKETEKKYSADKQAYQNQIQDNIQKSETDIKSHINEKIVTNRKRYSYKYGSIECKLRKRN